MKRKSKWKIILLIVLCAVLLGLAAFAQFTSTGYRMTVPFRGFDEVASNVYVDRTYTGDQSVVSTVIEEASARFRAFWGEVESSPLLIISDNEETLRKLGGDHDTLNVLFFGPRSYISVSKEYLNVDIVAHEMTHAELFKRIYDGKVWPEALIPTWFDEGVATQNDDREQYSEMTWAEKTNSGENTIPLQEMDTPEKFYAGDAEDRRLRYMESRHEVHSWIAEHGTNALFDLIARVNRGEDFYTLYMGQ